MGLLSKCVNNTSATYGCTAIPNLRVSLTILMLYIRNFVKFDSDYASVVIEQEEYT